jgi:DNA-binding response OmpR family regulator
MQNQPLIFVVDDDAMILKIIGAELKSMHLEAMLFSYGEECLSELHLKPDLIILDYIFIKGDEPVQSGLEILHEIRKVNVNVPVVILSGQESGSTVLDLIKLGIEDYIVKEGGFTTKLKEAVMSILKKDNSPGK